MFTLKCKAKNIWFELYLLRKLHGNKRMNEFDIVSEVK